MRLLVEKVQKDAQKVQGYLQRVLMLCYAGDTDWGLFVLERICDEEPPVACACCEVYETLSYAAGGSSL